MPVRLNLSSLLIALNVGLVLAAVVCVASVAVGLMESLADTEALARVSLAGAGALRSVDQAAEQLETSVRLLAERPTLRRLSQEQDSRSLTAFLAQFQRTSRVDGCAVFMGGRLFAASDAAAPWPALRARRPAGTAVFALSEPGGGPIDLAAFTTVPGLDGAEVCVMKRLDEAFAADLSERIGLPVAILDRAVAEGRTDDPRAPVREQALSSEEPASARISAAGVYVAALPLRSPSGEIIGVVEAGLSTATAESSVRRLVHVLVALTVAVAALASLLSFLMGRRLGRPMEALTESAARIGRGDLSTPVPRAPGSEVGTLSAAMEEMRGRLLHLTAELRRRQSEAEAVVTGIIEGVYTVDRERRIRYMNPQAARLLGIEAERAAGIFCGDVLKPQGRDGVRPCEEHCPIVHARFRGGARATEHLLLADGRRRTVVITSAPPAAGVAAGADAAGDAQQFQLLRDETEVETTRRLRDTVLANISHEFKTPLSAQLASIELLRERLPENDGEEVRQLVLSLERGTLRLTQLIDNLLESVRIEAGQDSIRRHRVRLDEIVEDAVEMTSPLIAQRGQRLEVNLPYPLPDVSGDATRLTQVFVNLLANASKFAPPGTNVSVGGEVGASTVTLWVEDEGPGLPPDAGSSIFDRFYRAPGEEPEQSGMGLGLWIVKSILERHGGSVEARSSGTGTRFCVRFPAAGEGGDAEEETSGRSGGSADA